MDEQTGDRQYGCWVYPHGREVPAEFWRKIELIYPDERGTATLIYRAEPPDGELPALMWKLQVQAAQIGFRIRVTTEDGTVTDAPPIGTTG